MASESLGKRISIVASLQSEMGRNFETFPRSQMTKNRVCQKTEIRNFHNYRYSHLLYLNMYFFHFYQLIGSSQRQRGSEDVDGKASAFVDPISVR